MRITRWTLPPIASQLAGPSATPTAINVGDYLCSERELYHVEQIGNEHAVLEDCRTGELSLLRRVDTS